MKILKLSITLILIILPIIAVGQTDYNPCPPGTPIKDCQTNTLNQVGSGGYGSIQATDAVAGQLATRVGYYGSILLSFLGVVFLFYVIYSGIQWMTAGGNEDKVKEARRRIVQAAIGLTITGIAYALTKLAVNINLI